MARGGTLHGRVIESWRKQTKDVSGVMLKSNKADLAKSCREKSRLARVKAFRLFQSVLKYHLSIII
jgi:hypothetical protein